MMSHKVLIVEDQFVEANDLNLMLIKAGYKVSGIARSVQAALEMIEEDKPDFIVVDIFLKGKLTGIDLAKILNEKNIAFIFLSANSNQEILAAAKTTEPYGFIVKPFREKDLLVTLEIAHYRHEHSLESKYKNEAELEKQLKNISQEPIGHEQAILKIATVLQSHIPFDYFTAGYNDLGKISNKGVSFLRTGFTEYQSIGIKELLAITGKSTDELMMLQPGSLEDLTARFYNDGAFDELCNTSLLKRLLVNTFQLKSHLILPLHTSYNEPFIFCFYSRKNDAYNLQHIQLFQRLQFVLNNTIKSLFAKENIIISGTQIHQNLQHKKLSQHSVFNNIIGNSHLLLNVFDHIMQVATVDTSVLVLGESGTGKERIADCIHNLSLRKTKPLIKVNCASLPAGLVESELFGHEKGAFTGALDKRIGKFEQASGGTIFLDEVGEMPLEMQVKLLRVLQEKEIERIGGKASIKVDVRIIAATNRNLEKEVAEGRFRLDLYYRLNVFPIILPALRERLDDIPALVAHFINIYNTKAGKKIIGVSDKANTILNNYSWPGNIRELEHLIERSVLLAKGSIIEEIALPVITQKIANANIEIHHTKSILENEREHILNVLKKSKGRIWGAGGAAELLKVPPTTLTSKIKKLGIKKEFIEL